MTTSRKEIGELLRLAVPIVLGQVGLLLMGVEDAVMVGRLGALPLAAVGIGNVFFFGVLILAFGILQALDPLISQAHGAEDEVELRSYFRMGLWATLLLFVPYAVLFLSSESILLFLGQTPTVSHLAAVYLIRLIPGLLPFLGFFAIRQVFVARGLLRPVLLSVLVANVLNIALNFVLIYGVGGWGGWGVAGSAWSTTIGRLAMPGFLILAVGRKEFSAMLWGEVRPEISLSRGFATLFRIGIPIGLHMGLEMWAFNAAAFWIGHLGEIPLAGHQVALNIASLSFMVPMGMGAAAATRVGQAIGRGDSAGVIAVSRAALWIGGGVMVFFAALFIALPELLARAYSNHLEVVVAAALLIPIAGFFQIFDGLQAVAAGILRGAADTHMIAIVNFISYWMIGLPFGWYIATRFGLGPRGIWWGLTLGVVLVALLLLWRVRLRLRQPFYRVS